ncbi:magnesium transporter CorA family protein [Candidatus Gracilibacteria bacterium]|nr:magnesium transporter CorA family protein [Candidatus Gracilibacteria bacterium]
MSEKNKIEKVRHSPQSFNWSDIPKPDESVIDSLQRTYKFHPLDLEDCLSESQRPKIDDYDDYIFMVLHIPIRSGRARHIKTSEVNIFIGPDFVITLHDNDPTIKKLFAECQENRKTREEYLAKGPGYFLYMLTDDLFGSCFPLLDSLGKNINDLESEVFDPDHSRDRLKDILMLKKDIINFRRMIIPQRAIVAQLEHKNKKFLPDNLDVYFDDVVDKIEKVWNNLENLQELTASLQETNESIISHNTNNIIKILTLFSVVMLPLTVITGFYGMNIIGLPFAEHGQATLIIGGLLFGVMVTMFAYFRFRRWI